MYITLIVGRDTPVLFAVSAAVESRQNSFKICLNFGSEM
jgi:hypothetical protein